MDPQATWQRLLDAYSAHDWAESKEAAEDLLFWLEKMRLPAADSAETRPWMTRGIARSPSPPADS